MSIPKTISGTITAWYSNDRYSPADLAANLAGGVGNLAYASCDMSASGWVKAGTATVTVELAEESEVIGNKVDALRTQKTKVMADAQRRITAIEGQIQQLLAITSEVSA